MSSIDLLTDAEIEPFARECPVEVKKQRGWHQYLVESDFAEAGVTAINEGGPS
jgi:hypothetical protein